MQDTLVIDFKNPSIGKFTVSFPKVGEYNDIQNIRMALTNNTYPQMCLSFTKEAVLNLDLIDAISTFAVLIPSLREKLNIKAFQELDMKTAKYLRNTYVDQYYPWYKKIYDEIYSEEDRQDDKLMQTQDEEAIRRTTESSK